MEKTKKQIFTKREIDIDLKNVVKRNVYGSSALLVLMSTFTIIAWVICDMEKNTSVIIWILFSVLALLNLGVLCWAVNCFYKLLKPLKYEIVTDTYQYVHQKPAHELLALKNILNLKSGNLVPFLCFKSYGEYCLICHFNVFYYKWSDLCCTRGHEMLQSISQGDEYYLIIENNKIVYIYSKRVFEFKETNT